MFIFPSGSVLAWDSAAARASAMWSNRQVTSLSDSTHAPSLTSSVAARDRLVRHTVPPPQCHLSTPAPVIELRAGRFRIVSLLTREAADDLRLEEGDLATAVVKATDVIMEVAPL